MRKVVANLDNDWVLTGADIDAASTEIEGRSLSRFSAGPAGSAKKQEHAIRGNVTGSERWG